MAQPKRLPLIKIICSCCDQSHTDYYRSFSAIYKGSKRLPICKTCVASLYTDFLNKTNDDYRLSLYYVCRLLDIVFVERIYVSVYQELQPNVGICGKFIQKINSLPQYNGKVFSDSDFLDVNDSVKPSVVTEDGFIVTEEMGFRWGAGLKSEDYKFLDRQLSALLPRADQTNTVQMMYVEDICQLRLEADKARKNNKLKEYNDTMKTISNLMSDANLKPMQDETDLGKISFGEWIARIENDEPIPEPTEEFKDVDGIGKYISKWFTNQIGVMLGAIKKDDYESDDSGDKS